MSIEGKQVPGYEKANGSRYERDRSAGRGRFEQGRGGERERRRSLRAYGGISSAVRGEEGSRERASCEWSTDSFFARFPSVRVPEGPPRSS